MALHWKDVDGKEETIFPPGYEIGFDIPGELLKRYPSKDLLIDRALRLGFYLGYTAGRESTDNSN